MAIEHEAAVQKLAGKREANAAEIALIDARSAQVRVFGGLGVWHTFGGLGVYFRGPWSLGKLSGALEFSGAREANAADIALIDARSAQVLDHFTAISQ